MENNKKVLYSLGFSDDDISEIVEFCPKIEFADTKRLLTNINLLINFGYPECDLKELFSVNPRILVYNNQELLEKLNKLGDNIEDKIKKNPHIL